MADEKRNMPMDPSAMEGSAEMHQNTPRIPYAMEQMNSEVETIFPDVTYEYSNRSPRHVAFTVRYTLADEDDQKHLNLLLEWLADPAYNEDPRIMRVLTDREGAEVTFVTNATFMDSRDPFGLIEAHGVMNEESGL